VLLPRDFLGYLAIWSAEHGGYDPRGNALAHAWLRLTYRSAVPVARWNVSPHVVTGVGVLVCAVVPALAVPGGAWPLLAVPVLAASGLIDGVDGAVAVLRGRVTRLGAVLDGLADRLGEALYVLALWLLGAPAWLCVVGAALAWLQEYARARAGLDQIGVVTVWERPTRIIVTAVALGFAAFVPSLAATAGAGAWVVLGMVGLVQFLAVAHRSMPAADRSAPARRVRRGR
jgi:phosphatidylglycerophosphate synthase